MDCPECGTGLEILIRGWPHLVQPGLFTIVQTCWDGCGWKQARHARLTFRSVTIDDAVLLWRWRNDAQTREASWNEEPIDLDMHRQWLSLMLTPVPGMSPILFLLACVGDIPVGNIRLSPTTPPEVSIVVAPEYRGSGLGRAMLALAPLPAGTIGIVKGENLASRGAFTAAGWSVRSIAYVKS
jgi:GNAT superfamily N-acetyltransferase